MERSLPIHRLLTRNKQKMESYNERNAISGATEMEMSWSAQRICHIITTKMNQSRIDRIWRKMVISSILL